MRPPLCSHNPTHLSHFGTSWGDTRAPSDSPAGTRKHWRGVFGSAMSTPSQKGPGQAPKLSYPEFSAVFTCSLKLFGPPSTLLGLFSCFPKDSVPFSSFISGHFQSSPNPSPPALPLCPPLSSSTAPALLGALSPFKGLLTACLPLGAGPQERQGHSGRCVLPPLRIR